MDKNGNVTGRIIFDFMEKGISQIAKKIFRHFGAMKKTNLI